MFLCIDTITGGAGAGIVDGEKVYFAAFDRMHASERLLMTIDSLLKEAEAGISDLKGIFVIKGPGSFTGLRVGISAANALSHSLKIPITGIRTEELSACKTDEADFLYLQSLNRDEVYLKGFGRLTGFFDTFILPVRELLSQKNILWLGELSEAHRQSLSESFTEIKNQRTPAEMWKEFSRRFSQVFSKKIDYEYVEAFYGKEPTITKRITN